MNHEPSKRIGDFYRDLSANYGDYCNGYAPWPEKPDNIPEWHTAPDLAGKGDVAV